MLERPPVYYFSLRGHTAFMPLKYAYPECAVLIREHPKLEPMQCFQTSCPVNKNCAEVLARRVHYLFDRVLHGHEALIFYFKMRNAGFMRHGERVVSMGAVSFSADLDEPKWMKINRFAFDKYKREGAARMWVPTDEFLFMGGTGSGIIPAINLIRTSNE